MVDFTNPNNRTGVAQAGESVRYDQGLRSYMMRVYNHMGIGLALTGLVAMLTVSYQPLFNAIVGTPLYWVVALAEIGMVIYFVAKVNSMSESKARTVFYLYSALNGLTFAVFFAIYTNESIARVFFITASMFGAMSIYGYTTKKDLTSWGSFLFMGLIGIIIASIVNIFVGSSALSMAVSVIGVFIFVGLTAYDTQKIKEMYYMVGADRVRTAAIRGALSLYLDFINLMIMLMHILGDRR